MEATGRLNRPTAAAPSLPSSSLGASPFFQAAALGRILPAIATDGTGSANLQLSLNDAPFTVCSNIITPCETWRFQSCYRDPLGGPSRFNLSDGLAVSFCS